MYKAIKNFKCNSISKLKGEELTSFDEEEIGSILLSQLVKDQLIEFKGIEEKPKPVRKKRVTKKKVT
jgi:hypothetical protein|tara:strand:+ start:3447 stop:3647 length:201 start_codon:yes stop_codon:yes gene_type:complete